MSERNQIKNRKCKRCGVTVRGKAFKLREHTRGHVSVEREAAAQAVLKKLHEDMLKADVLPASVGSISETTRMADEEFLNAEGD